MKFIRTNEAKRLWLIIEKERKKTFTGTDILVYPYVGQVWLILCGFLWGFILILAETLGMIGEVE